MCVCRFGRSEKVAVPYSQLLWSDFLRDFIVQVRVKYSAVQHSTVQYSIDTVLLPSSTVSTS